jgi:hypothetical protein
MRVKRHIWIIALLWAFVIGPFIVLAFYNFPIADDYPCTWYSIESGIVTSVHSWYVNWTARYFAAFLWAVNPLVLGSIAGYQLSSIALLVFMWLALFVSIQWLLKPFGALSNTTFALLATVFCVFHVGNMPSIQQGLYYYNAYVCYQPAAFFILLWLSAIIRFNFYESIQTWWLLLFTCGLVVCTIGSNESAMDMILLLCISFFMLYRILHRRVSLVLFLNLITAIACSAFIILSPATKIRLAHNTGIKRTGIEVAAGAIGYLFTEISMWFWSISMLGVMLFTLAFLGRYNSALKKVPLHICFIATVNYLLLLFVSLLPSFAGEGMVQSRTANGIFLIAWFGLLLVMALWLTAYRDRILQFSYLFKHKNLLYFFLIPLAISPNVLLVYHDLTSGEAAAYKREQIARIDMIRQSASDSVFVPPLQYKPVSIGGSDIGQFTADYDSYMAKVHGKKWIFLTEKPAKIYE